MSFRPYDITGNVYGKLTAIKLISTEKRGAIWLCKCECGNETTAWAKNLKDGRKKSCGCLWVTNGKYTGWNKKTSKLKATLSSMKQRCNNPNDKGYRYYGAKGVSVCQEWKTLKDFETWALANGYQEGLTIDRIDSDGNYEPSNCQWISRKENARKQRRGLKNKQFKTA